MSNRTYFGDCRASMRRLIADGVKVQMCVTSPPYFGLRSYDVEGQLGLEDCPDDYVNSMVEVFSLVRELLMDDGTLWLNLGDSYANAARKAKPKDLLGIPWRVAFGLQADGWCLRQDLIWHKPNPLPESVQDRCTKAHEYLFLLSKSTNYYFDSEAMKEPAAGPPKKCGPKNDKSRNDSDRTGIVRGDGVTRNRRSVWSIATKPYSKAHFATFPPALIEPCVLAGSRAGDIVLDPFMGSGTTAEVAQKHGRRWIGCELNTAYAALQQGRTGVCMDEYVWEYIVGG